MVIQYRKSVISTFHSILNPPLFSSSSHKYVKPSLVSVFPNTCHSYDRFNMTILDIYTLCQKYMIIIKQKMTEDKENRFTPAKAANLAERQRRPLIGTLNNYVRSVVSSKQREEQMEKKYVDVKLHPAGKYILGSKAPSVEEYKRFARLLYQGIFYSICSLKGPSDEFIRKKCVRLPQARNKGLKFLMLDLDQTLIHSVFDKQKSDVVLKDADELIKFNVRPYCTQFLQNLSDHFEIYIFTASTQDYAKPIVEFLNMKKKTIQGILSRSNCLETSHGFKIKDLRVIRNRGLEDIIIVDNLVHSFGLQLDNGIPILEFTNNKEDRELIGLQRFLMELKSVKDVRKAIQAKLNIKKCLEIDQDEFMTVKKSYRVSRIKKRQTVLY